MRGRETFQTVRTEGALLPPDLLRRVLDRDTGLPGLSEKDYGLLPGERLNEVINRSWNRLLGAWQGMRAAASDEAQAAQGRRWLLALLAELGYGRIGAGNSPIPVPDRPYSVSNSAAGVPLHLVGFGVEIDRRTAGARGAAQASPHAILQELLNRSPAHLWGIVTNGRRLRLLRDNLRLTRQAFVEFDLDGMMAGEVYADFAMLWLACHATRLEPRPAEGCYLEQWSRAAGQEGIRALDTLRKGVEEAITVLGRGFLAHAANGALREELQGGAQDAQEYYRQVLRTVYRLLFLFVAEDRGLLLDPAAPEAARARYTAYYSTARLRELAGHRRAGHGSSGRHGDLWHGLRLVLAKLGEDGGCPALALPALGGLMGGQGARDPFAAAELANADLLAAVRALAYTQTASALRPVDYRNLSVEEMGSVYESLLELHPTLSIEGRTFELGTIAGSERKTTGSYYTPDSLVLCLLDSALEPVLAQAARAPDPEAAILDLKIVDPACGSGHFLIAAARRVARRLAAITTGEEEPSPEALRHELRRVIGRCIYGVDINPMAVELCKVALWMEALEPGRPLSFLDHHIKCGHSLVGVFNLDVLSEGIPDGAYTPVTGDDKATAAALRKRNKSERAGQMSFDTLLLDTAGVSRTLARDFRALDQEDERTVGDVQAKAQLYEELRHPGGRWWSYKTACDLWTAAFFMPMVPPSGGAPLLTPTSDAVRRSLTQPNALHGLLVGEVTGLARRLRFFHWPLEFPEVFAAGGFQVVLGNPPWEQLQPEEIKFFAIHDPRVAALAGAQRKAAMAKLEPVIALRWEEYKRGIEAGNRFLRESGRFPLTATGKLNTYSLFAEESRGLVSPTGRAGIIIPSGIASDDSNKEYFADLVERGALVSLYDFENQGLFAAVDSRYKFCLLTLTGAEQPRGEGAEFAFFLHSTEELAEPDRRFRLTAADMALLNPNTRTCPVFRSRRDAELARAIYRRAGVLVREARDGQPEHNPWGVSFQQMFNMTTTSHLFRTREDLEQAEWELAGNVFVRGGARYLPLYEAKLFHQFDHRFATFAGRTREEQQAGKARDLTPAEHQSPTDVVLPRYWVPEEEVLSRTSKGYSMTTEHTHTHTHSGMDDSIPAIHERDKHENLHQHDSSGHRSGRDGIAAQAVDGWLLVFRDITNATNERTALWSLMPATALGHTAAVLHPVSVGQAR